MSVPARLLIVLLLALALFGSGAWLGLDYEQGRVAKRDLSVAVGRENALREAVLQQTSINAGISGDLALQRDKARRDRNSYEEDLRHATSIFTVQACAKVASEPINQPGTEPQIAIVVPAVSCGADCMRLWNDGLAQGLPASYGAWGTDGPAAGADPPGPGAAPYAATVTELFANHGQNGALCNDLRAQLLGWQRWARDNQLVKGPSDAR